VTVQVPFPNAPHRAANEPTIFVPRVIEIRIDPWDRLGIFKDTADAILAAVRDCRRFTFNTFVALALVRPVSTPDGIDVDVTGDGATSSAIVVVGAIVDDVVVLATVVTTEEDELLGGIVEAIVVVAATVVVTAIVVVVASVVVVVVVVVVGNALKNGTATATLLLSWVLPPSWPKSFQTPTLHIASWRNRTRMRRTSRDRHSTAGETLYRCRGRIK
jgi:hypothetical protein